MSDLQDKINYKRNYNKYLDEIKSFSKKDFCVSNLLSLDETRSLQKKMAQINHGLSKKFYLDFSEYGCSKLQDFIESLYQVYSGPVLLWTESSNSCGAYALSSILEFNSVLNFDASSDGIVVLLAKDLSGRVVLDFMISEHNGKEMLEIESFGDKWVNISCPS